MNSPSPIPKVDLVEKLDPKNDIFKHKMTSLSKADRVRLLNQSEHFLDRIASK